ncbi:lactate dehydrogenase [Sphingomonas sp. Leaf357]|uniref:FAD-binding oxidoreductase n=1 Tax=Sphingomonas sp. Leaf357 TaxID=1736350 RepID=UPI0006F5DBC5|nr:FAD-linked oxidase C-terminal domain-containing protein [Sphingomonas sp. Leaf357]KQS04961.1 lactate dehydrogenase [Sphingomonas sp. Leaf357]
MHIDKIHARPPLDPGFVAALRQRFGDALDTGEAARAQHGASEAHFAPMPPDAVVFAQSTEEVVDLVKLCTAAGVPIVPYGAGTSIEGNALAVRGGVSVNLSRMTEIVAVHAEDFDCTVQAGVRREELNVHLRDQGLFFPIDPGANATIGGMASTRASGTNAVRYGTMREAVLSLTVVTPDGKAIKTATRARKSAAGYDLTRLFVGSEGTLGIITEVTLRLHPIPETISSAVCGFDSLQGAVDTVVQSIQCGVPLARVEILDDKQMAAVNAWSKLGYPEVTTLFFEFHGSPAGVEEQVTLVRDLAAANGGGEFQWSNLPEERAKLWKARHEAYYAAVNVRPGAVGWTTDVCVPISRLPECILETKRDLEAGTVPATILGHVGDGNFHVIFSMDPNSTEELHEVEGINARLVQRALRMDGTCTGEHGIGIGKQDWLVAELGEAVEVMRTLKRALDPQDLFNPGKIFSL